MSEYNTYIPPPPPPPSASNGGCWKIGAITCGVLGCLGVIGIAIIAMMVMRMPMTKSIINSAFLVKQMTTVKHSLDMYAKDNGHYPDTLDELVPKYVSDSRKLRFTREPNGPEFTYHKPDKKTKDDDSVLEYTLPAPLPKSMRDAPPWTIKVYMNNKVDDEYVYVNNGKTIRINAPATSGPGME